MDDDGTGYYVLSLSMQKEYPRLTKRLIDMYENAFAGSKDSRIKDLDELRDVCKAVHFVEPALEKYGTVECEANPGCFVCSCKGFKHVGICSHVIAINHVTKKYNARQQLLRFGKRKQKDTHGNTKRPIPALLRAPQREADSSTEEEEEAARLGEEGL